MAKEKLRDAFGAIFGYAHGLVNIFSIFFSLAKSEKRPNPALFFAVYGYFWLPRREAVVLQSRSPDISAFDDAAIA